MHVVKGLVIKSDFQMVRRCLIIITGVMTVIVNGSVLIITLTLLAFEYACYGNY